MWINVDCSNLMSWTKNLIKDIEFTLTYSFWSELRHHQTTRLKKKKKILLHCYFINTSTIRTKKNIYISATDSTLYTFIKVQHQISGLRSESMRRSFAETTGCRWFFYTQVAPEFTDKNGKNTHIPAALERVCDQIS